MLLLLKRVPRAVRDPLLTELPDRVRAYMLARPRPSRGERLEDEEQAGRAEGVLELCDAEWEDGDESDHPPCAPLHFDRMECGGTRAADSS